MEGGQGALETGHSWPDYIRIQGRTHGGNECVTISLRAQDS